MTVTVKTGGVINVNPNGTVEVETGEDVSVLAGGTTSGNTYNINTIAGVTTNAAITGGVTTSVAPNAAFDADMIGLYCVVDAYNTSAELCSITGSSAIAPVGGGTFANSHSTGVPVMILNGHTIDAAMFGCAPGTGNSTYLQALLDQLPTLQTGWSTVGSGRANGWRINFTPTKSTEVYQFATEVVVPSDVNVSIFGGPHGCRWQYTGSGEYVLKVGDTTGKWRTFEISGIAFEEGGIELTGQNAGMVTITKNRFEQIEDYAIKFLGISIVGGEIAFNEFSDCVGSIGCAYASCDNWIIRGNNSTRGRGTDILTASSGWQLLYNGFETHKTADAATLPWIAVTGSDVQIVGTRFGGEAPTSYAPPREAIVIGPVGSTTTTAVTDVLIRDNRFSSTNGTVSSTEADSCIRFNAPVARCRIVGNTVNKDYNTAFINEAYVSAQPANIYKSFSNHYSGNTFDYIFTADEFTNGGRGFGLTKPTKGRNWQNLLRLTTDLTSGSYWSNTNCTVAKNATDPGGVANNAFTLTKTAGTGVAYVAGGVQNVASNVTGGLTFSVWLKAGTMTRARIYFSQTTNNYTQDTRLQTLHLTDDWRRYDCVMPEVDTSKAYFILIAIGAETTVDNALTGTIFAYGPQVVDGFEPAPFYLPNKHTSGTIHAALSIHGSVIGESYHDYGSAAPSSGRYEVGDVVYNTAPTAGGTLGWVCTTAGSPGTWKTFGSIAA